MDGVVLLGSGLEEITLLVCSVMVAVGLGVVGSVGDNGSFIGNIDLRYTLVDISIQVKGDSFKENKYKMTFNFECI